MGRLAVDGNSPGGNRLFQFATGTVAGIGKRLVQLD
jgi:hypothetical protein